MGFEPWPERIQCHTILSIVVIGNFCNNKGGSPGLVVMGDDSCSRGHGCESRCCILNGDFILICCKNVLFA